jgi:hypothetical protein
MTSFVLRREDKLDEETAAAAPRDGPANVPLASDHWIVVNFWIVWIQNDKQIRISDYFWLFLTISGLPSDDQITRFDVIACRKSYCFTFMCSQSS